MCTAFAICPCRNVEASKPNLLFSCASACLLLLFYTSFVFTRKLYAQFTFSLTSPRYVTWWVLALIVHTKHFLFFQTKILNYLGIINVITQKQKRRCSKLVFYKRQFVTEYKILFDFIALVTYLWNTDWEVSWQPIYPADVVFWTGRTAKLQVWFSIQRSLFHWYWHGFAASTDSLLEVCKEKKNTSCLTNNRKVNVEKRGNCWLA